MLETTLAIVYYFLFGIASVVYWNHKGDIKPSRNDYWMILLGPFALIVGAFKFGDTGITFRRGIEFFGLAGTLKGESLSGSPGVLLVMMTILFIVSVLFGLESILIGTLARILIGMLVPVGGAYVTALAYRSVAKSIEARVEKTLDQPLNS